ncbi:MAG: hypothetical protein KKF98_00605 [Bacteroidetes bacterium]|nr:hypothetical protein [Bacteroidota bacterium]
MKSIPYIIITILLLALFLQHKYTPEPKTIIDIQTTTDTIHDTISNTIHHYTPKPIYTDTGSTKWRWNPVDTNEILADYFARHFYMDTLQNDSNALIILYDTVSQNQITYRQPHITLYSQLIRQTTIVEVSQSSKNKLFFGMALGRNPNQFSLAPSVLLQSKKGRVYSLSYDILNKDLYVGIHWQLWFNR